MQYTQYGLYSNVIFTWGFVRILNFNQNTMEHAMFNEAKPNCAEPMIKNNNGNNKKQNQIESGKREHSERYREGEGCSEGGENRVKSIWKAKMWSKCNCIQDNIKLQTMLFLPNNFEYFDRLPLYSLFPFLFLFLSRSVSHYPTSFPPVFPSVFPLLLLTFLCCFY